MKNEGSYLVVLFSARASLGLSVQTWPDRMLRLPVVPKPNNFLPNCVLKLVCYKLMVDIITDCKRHIFFTIIELLSYNGLVVNNSILKK